MRHQIDYERRSQKPEVEPHLSRDLGRRLGRLLGLDGGRNGCLRRGLGLGLELGFSQRPVLVEVGPLRFAGLGVMQAETSETDV